MSSRLAALLLAITLPGCYSLPSHYPLPHNLPFDHYQVKPGDVLFLTLWVNTARSGKTGTYPSLTVQERLVMRRVKEGEKLRPNEAALLGATITTLIKARHNKVVKDAVKEEAKLWNAFIAGLKVQRVGLGAPELAFLAEDACNALQEGDEGLRAAFIHDRESECSAVPKEVRGVSESDTSGLWSILQTIGNPAGESYEDQNPAAAHVELYRAGASMNEGKGGEELWTLAEWEVSGICNPSSEKPEDSKSGNPGKGRGNIIQEVRFKNNIFGLRVVEDGAWEVSIDSKTGEREVKKSGNGPRDTLSRKSLSFLFPGDIAWIAWAVPVHARFQSACKSA